MKTVSYDYKEKLKKIEDVIKPADLEDYGFKNESQFKEIEKKVKEDNGEPPSLFRLITINAIIIGILYIIGINNDCPEMVAICIFPAYFLLSNYKKKKELYDSGAIDRYKEYKHDNKEYEFISDCDGYIEWVEKMEKESRAFAGYEPQCIKELNLVIAIWDYYYMQFHKKTVVEDKKFILTVIKDYLIPNSLSYNRTFGFMDLESCLSFIHGYGIVTDEELYEIVQNTIKKYRDLLTRHEIISLTKQFPKEKIGKYFSRAETLELLRNKKTKTEIEEENKKYKQEIDKLKITKKELEINKINDYVTKNIEKYIDELVETYGYENWRDCYIDKMAEKGIPEESSAKMFDNKKVSDKMIADTFTNYVFGLESFYDLMKIMDIENKKSE